MINILNVLYFSDPFFPMIFLFNSWLPGMLDAIFQATFLCALLMFWLCIYHGLRQNERKFFNFYLPKLIVLLPIWLCAIVLATWEKCNELRDPTYNHFIDTGNYNVSDFSLSAYVLRRDENKVNSFFRLFLFCRDLNQFFILLVQCICSIW